MKHFILALCALIGTTFCLCAQNSGKQHKQAKQVMVAYFSATGTTKAAAKLIANATGGTLTEITPVKAYTDADLDWRNKSSRSSVEMHNAKARPACKKTDVSKYNVIYIGYPIWWNEAPRIINTWIEANNLKGKTIIPFATSGGNTINNSATILKKAYPSLKWQEGRLLNNANAKTIESWVK